MRSVNAALPLMLKMLITLTLMLTIVNCQPQKLTDIGLREPDTDTTLRRLPTGLEHVMSRHRRRLAAVNINTDDDGDDDDVRWLLVGAAAATAGVTLLITTFALCTCCHPYSKRYRNDESYIGQIDLEDIRVICNRAVTSPGNWSTNTDSGVVVNARALDLRQQQHGDCTILNNQRVAPAKECFDSKAAAADVAGAGDNASDAEMSDVLMENGRIVLQYRNVHAGVRPTENPASKLHEPDTLDSTGPGHVIGKPQAYQDYDMNDVVWKNMAASSTKI